MVILEGVAFPLDVLNKNGWGIPSSDADSAINSLKYAVVRVCSRNSPHGCDIAEDPKSEIGKVLDAWKEGSNVYTKVDITDSIAATKLKEGTWQKKWSVYGKAGALNEGWTNGVDIRSITLVTNPAWEQSTFDVAASSSYPKEDPKLLFLNDFSITATVVDTMTEPTTTPPGGPSPAEYEQRMADSQKQIDTLISERKALAEQVAALTKEKEELNTVAASLKEEIGKMVTIDDAKTMMAAAIADDHEAQARTAAIGKLTASRAVFGLETDPKTLVNLSASDINKQAEELGQIEISASVGQVKYKANNTGNTGGRLKVFDPFKREINGGF